MFRCRKVTPHYETGAEHTESLSARKSSVVDAEYAALEHRPEALDAVRVHVAPNVLAGGVVNR